ncbi:hypothetical protein AWM70_14215 [Paenibacillus yonginensis]|uniref:N-acetyltransferase domain-containing protein n=1 Tax=Paenibacillus yonginensis TaxID=1462996 RepID=A0A1B1N2H0_9BACL|nr:GNAT family N-acetyltransferase [Paenibacillus yonginensis]ANS75606.1 hypothetical protein AWM70_14215 [Paenibacillus yonginensis]
MPTSLKQELRNRFPMLQSERLLLRKVLPKDEQELHGLLNEPLIQRYIAFRPETAGSAERLRRYFEDCHFAMTSLHFVVSDRESGSVAGLCSFQRWNEEEGNANIGYMIAPRYWNRGMATEAASMLLEFGFGRLGLKRVYACCAPDNEASGKVLHKCGFERLGRSNRASWKKGKEVRPAHYFMLAAESRQQTSVRYALLHN